MFVRVATKKEQEEKNVSDRNDAKEPRFIEVNKWKYVCRLKAATYREYSYSNIVATVSYVFDQIGESSLEYTVHCRQYSTV